jgi:catechol 2,3-dioxygenase-like lactoylglutathione lyase family enzyme
MPKKTPPIRFRSNRCVAVHVPDLAAAEKFYGGVLGFKLKSKSRSHLEFATGTLLLYVNRSARAQSPVPSFTVPHTPTAQSHLRQHGCQVKKVGDHGAYFRDPFGFTWDIIDV